MQKLAAIAILIISGLFACDDDPIINSQKEIPWVVTAPSDSEVWHPPWPFSLAFPLTVPPGTYSGPSIEVGPGSLEVTEKQFDAQAALRYLLKIRTIDNAKHFDEAIQFLIAQACGDRQNAKIFLEEFYPMQFVHKV